MIVRRRLLGADLAAGHRRVQVVAAARVDLFGEFLGGDRADRGHVDHQRAAFQPLGRAAFAEQHGFHVRACPAPSGSAPRTSAATASVVANHLGGARGSRRSGCCASGTIRSWPAFFRLSAIGRPMMPRPMNPIFMCVSLYRLAPSLREGVGAGAPMVRWFAWRHCPGRPRGEGPDRPPQEGSRKDAASVLDASRFSQPSPATVSPAGRYSQPTQPR